MTLGYRAATVNAISYMKAVNRLYEARGCWVPEFHFLQKVLLTFYAVTNCMGPTAIAQTSPTPPPTIKLRAAYLATNPAQAVRDAASGEMRGASYTLAQAFSAKLGLPLDFMPLSGPPVVIEAIRAGAADIGFVAYEATRVGAVEFSQTYMLVQQTFLIRKDVSVERVSDIDRAGLRIGGTVNDSMTLCLKRILKQATLVELESKPQLLSEALSSGKVDALAANRQRLTTLQAGIPGSKILADNLFNVPQTIVVAKSNSELLAQVDAFIDEVRATGFLRDAITRSGVVGIEAAGKSPGSAHGCPD